MDLEAVKELAKLMEEKGSQFRAAFRDGPQGLHLVGRKGLGRREKRQRSWPPALDLFFQWTVEVHQEGILLALEGTFPERRRAQQ